MSTDKRTPEQSDICANCGMEYHTHNLAPKAHKECNNGRGYFKSVPDLLATLASQSSELSKLRDENERLTKTLRDADKRMSEIMLQHKEKSIYEFNSMCSLQDELRKAIDYVRQ